MVINVVVAALSAIATALGVTSCMWFDISGLTFILIFVGTRRSDTPCFILYLLTDRTDRQTENFIINKCGVGANPDHFIGLNKMVCYHLINLNNMQTWQAYLSAMTSKKKNWKVRKDFLREGGWKRKTGDASRRYRFSADKLI